MADGMFTLVLGDEHKPEIKTLTSVPRKYLSPVVALNSACSEIISPSLEPGLVILTDTVYYAMDAPIMLRKHFPKARFVALFDRVEPETEMAEMCGDAFPGVL